MAIQAGGRRLGKANHEASINPPSTNDESAYKFGSCYNIPAANESYDLAIMASWPGQPQFPYFAIKESLRILKERGKLAIIVRDATAGPEKGTHDVDPPAGELIAALKDLGLRIPISHLGSGCVVLQKRSAGPLFSPR